MIKIKNLTCLCNDYCLLCNLKNIKYLKPILDIETCWNSTYYILNHLKQLKPALGLLSADHRSVKEFYPNEEDWIIIKVKTLV